MIKRKVGRPKKVIVEEEDNGLEDNTYKKDESSLGIFQHSSLVNGSGGYFNSEKIIVCGGSGAGKSTLTSNILVYICKKYSHIILITGSCDDASYLLIKKLCDDNKIHFTIINADGDDKGNIVTPILKRCVLIFDDLQKANGGEGKALKTLISNAFIRGRHDFVSTIWNCHSLKYIPDLVKNSCNMLFIDRAYPQIPLSSSIDTKNKWYMLNSFLNPSMCKVVEFKPLAMHFINKRLQSKIWKEDRGKSYADLKVKYGIMMNGNDSKELKQEVDEGVKSNGEGVKSNAEGVKSNHQSSTDNFDDLYNMALSRNYY